MKRLWLTPAAALIVISAPFAAAMANPLHLAMAALEPHALTFVQAPGYTAVDPAKLVDSNYYSPRNFPGDHGTPSILLPDANLDAVTRAILLLEAQEATLPRVRYRITYSLHHNADVPEAQQAYVDVRRYNLGPTLRAALTDAIGAEHVASADAFGTGPHVAWRFVMSPMMGMMADATHASRRELTDQQALAADCLGEPCLSLADPSAPVPASTPEPMPPLEPPRYLHQEDGVARPAHVARTLWASITSEGMDPLPYHDSQPQFTFVISMNVAGQDNTAFGIARQNIVMDDAIAAIWTQRQEVAGMAPGLFRSWVPRAR